MILKILLGSFLFTLMGCSHLFYFPSQQVYMQPHRLEHPPESKMISSGENQISIWQFKAPNKKPRAKILLFHGNAENVSTHFMALYWILKSDYEFAVFDYPGYGSSTGKPTRASTTDAGRDVLRWYSAQSPEVPLVVFGQSLGGNIALYSVAKEKEIPVCLVAVESTFKSYRTVARRTANKHWLTWLFQPLAYLLVSNSNSGGDHIAEISPTPLLVIHGDSDPVVDAQNGLEVFEEAKEPKEFWSVPGGQHISAFFGADRDVFREKFIKTINQKCLK